MSHTVETMQPLKSSYIFAHPLACWVFCFFVWTNFVTGLPQTSLHLNGSHWPKTSCLQMHVPTHPSLFTLTKLQAATDNWQMFGHCVVKLYLQVKLSPYTERDT